MAEQSACVGMFEVVGLQKWAGQDDAHAAFEFVEFADTVINEVECLDEFDSGNFVDFLGD